MRGETCGKRASGFLLLIFKQASQTEGLIRCFIGAIMCIAAMCCIFLVTELAKSGEDSSQNVFFRVAVFCSYLNN